MKRKQLILVYILFGLSGFSALTYQITWIRELGTFFGIQVYSTTTVLTAFMAGLALGSYLFGKIADKVKNIFLLFAAMEILLAGFAIGFPFIKQAIASIYLFIAPVSDSNVLLNQFIRFLVAFPFLLFATSLMGGTLPVLTRAITQDRKSLGHRISMLYGSNNLGAMLGGALTGYLFLKTIGISGALIIAAAFNALNALLIVFVKVPDSEKQVATHPETNETNYKNYRDPRMIRMVLWVFIIEGFTTLAYEIIWTRILNEFSYDKTSFFYTTVIITFVGGLSIGSYIMSKYIRKIKDPLKILAYVQAGIGIFYLLTFVLFILTAPSFQKFRESSHSWLTAIGSEQLYIFLILIIPVVLMGFTFPLVSIIYNRSSAKIGIDIGLLGSLDTIGSVAGSLIGGFVLIPAIGTIKAFLFIVLINLILSAWILQNINQKKSRMLIRVPIILAASLMLIPQKQTIELNRRWNEALKKPLIYYNEGPVTSVAVTRYQDNYAALSINGAITAYTLPADVLVHKMLATLPWLYSEQPENALVVGLGIGITANMLTQTGISDIAVAEISPEVIWVSRNVFGYSSGKENPAPEYYLEDGRAHLFRLDTLYDIITTNAVHPRLGNNIYTKEFYELCYSKISENGKMCQWIPTNWLTEKEYKILIRSFTDVFDYSCLWLINDSHTIVLGSKKPFNHSVGNFEKKISVPQIRNSLENSYITNISDILQYFWLTNAQLKDFTREGALNTDDKPVVEFSQRMNRAPNHEVLTYMTKNTDDISDVFHFPEADNRLLEISNHKHNMLNQRLKDYVSVLKAE